MNNQKAVLYDVEWQMLRVNTLTQNNDYGGWNTVEGVKINITKFRKYLLVSEFDAQEYFYRLWRVLNMLNAVRMGYSGTKQAESEQDILVKQFRDIVSEKYHDMSDEYEFKEWDWDRTAHNLKVLKTASPSTFDKIYKNLTMRKSTTEKNRGTLSFRPELVKFIELMDAASKDS